MHFLALLLVLVAAPAWAQDRGFYSEPIVEPFDIVVTPPRNAPFDVDLDFSFSHNQPNNLLYAVAVDCPNAEPRFGPYTFGDVSTPGDSLYSWHAACRVDSQVASYDILVYLLDKHGNSFASKVASTSASAGVAPVIGGLNFTNIAGGAVDFCTQPCADNKFGGFAVSDSNITWKGDFTAPRCAGADLTDPNAACYETTLGTTSGTDIQTLIPTAIPDLTEVGQQQYRVVLKDVEGQSTFQNVSLDVLQQSVNLTGTPTITPAGGCTIGTDCTGIMVSVAFRDTCPGQTTDVYVDDDASPLDGIATLDTLSPVTVGPFSFTTSGSKTFSIQVACGAADPVSLALAYTVSDSPAADTFDISPSSPVFLNDSLITPATLEDWCISFTGTEDDTPVTNIDVTINPPDSPDAGPLPLVSDGVQETDCVDDDPVAGPTPIPCPEQWCLSEGGFSALSLPDDGLYTLAVSAQRGVPALIRSAAVAFTLTDPVSVIGDLTTDIGDPNATLFFSAPDNTNPPPQCFNATSKNAQPVTWLFTPKPPILGWVTQLTTSNGTCTGTSSCTGSTPAQICVTVSDTTGTTNGPPTGVAVPDYSIQLPTSSQALSCGTVTDPNSDPIVYLWTKSGATCGSFSATNVAAPTMTGLTAGSCIVTCDASDPAGSNSHVTDSGTITVAAAGGGGTNWTADSKCRAFYNFENDGSPLADDCDDGGNSDDLSVLFGSAAYVTTDKPTGVGAAFRWFDCAGTSTLLSTSGTNASNRLQDNEFTIFAVLRTATDMTTQYYMGNWVTADSGNAGWRMHIDSLGRWRNYMTGPISAAVDPVASTIYTVSMSFHRNAVGEGTRFYVNGINDANYNQTTGGAGNVAAGDGELQVCGYDGAASFDGYISSILYLGGAGAYLDATESRDLCRFGPKGDWADRSTECD